MLKLRQNKPKLSNITIMEQSKTTPEAKTARKGQFNVEEMKNHKSSLWKDHKWKVLGIAALSFGAGYGAGYYFHASAAQAAEVAREAM